MLLRILRQNIDHISIESTSLDENVWQAPVLGAHHIGLQRDEQIATRRCRLAFPFQGSMLRVCWMIASPLVMHSTYPQIPWHDTHLLSRYRHHLPHHRTGRRKKMDDVDAPSLLWTPHHLLDPMGNFHCHRNIDNHYNETIRMPIPHEWKETWHVSREVNYAEPMIVPSRFDTMPIGGRTISVSIQRFHEDPSLHECIEVGILPPRQDRSHISRPEECN
mmetsp:Transcript_22582/g.40406  ORF Transcript_22582/g.40406 Transcript_22582/m.40406 type:complete len:219 (+) Transcript_22582:630-1286(+)